MPGQRPGNCLYLPSGTVSEYAQQSLGVVQITRPDRSGRHRSSPTGRATPLGSRWRWCVGGYVSCSSGGPNTRCRRAGLRVPPLLVQHRLPWVVGAAVEDIGTQPSSSARVVRVKRGTISRNSFSRPAFTARSCGRLFLLGRAAPQLLDRIGENVIVTEARVLGLNLASEVDGPVCLVAGRCGPPQLTS